jgi:hypothetical protein
MGKQNKGRVKLTLPLLLLLSGRTNFYIKKRLGTFAAPFRATKSACRNGYEAAAAATAATATAATAAI